MSALPQSILDHAQSPHGRGTMPDASATGRASLGGRPPEVTVYLRVAGDRIEQAMFQASGCGYTIACCSVLTELIEGKSRSFAQELTPADVLAQLEDVPPHRQFCAALAIEALQNALAPDANQGSAVDRS